ncbi:hypothetical protein [Novipirellula artificiosorum]|uniref:Uncharacterized protein n=1 Tax=Novipirellula artificiosorum TaxID=2528016 RepID=A0A5C6DJP3_9BACT|nr:hypothetical protein [Novipirellula artificiosorum]TWU35129.1 hypothetical protein Poly41_42730 [Novipirellula artificiosorum]
MSQTTPPTSNQHDGVTVHTGHDLEVGILSRVREWVDLFGWLRLVRTLRFAGSPTMVSLSVLTLMVWWLGPYCVSHERLQLAAIDGSATSLMHASNDSLTQLTGYFRGINATTLFHPGLADRSLLACGGSILWTLLVWAPAALVFARQGALLTAGRSMMPIAEASRMAVKRSPSAWIAALVPFACVLMMAVMIFAVAWGTRLAPESLAVQIPGAIFIALLSIPCGLLAFGANVAVPLAWSALSNEKDPDSLDSLSRGYEYLYRRPLHLLIHLAVAWVLLMVVALLATTVALTAALISWTVLDLAAAPAELSGWVGQILSILPIASCFAFAWALIGGVYLLMRHEAGGQQVEDLWIPDPKAAAELPQLNR